MSVGWVAVGANLLGSVISSNAAGDAADTQAQATRDASNATLQGQREAIAAQQPFLNGGYAATNRLQELLGIGGSSSAAGYGSLNTPFSFTPGDLTQTPGYQFTQKQGQQALDRKAAAGGGFYSGAGLEGAAAFNQDLAGTTYDKEYTRALNEFQTNRANTLNPLQALAGQGQTSANTVSNAGVSTGNSLASLIASNGNAQGAAQIAQGNALNGGINSALTAWQRAQLFGNNGQVGSGQTFFNDPTDPYGYNATNGSDASNIIFSDARLKTNILPIGMTKRGNALYSWDWKTGGSGQGVIAQEVAHIPGAVHVDADGLLMVDYSKV